MPCGLSHQPAPISRVCRLAVEQVEHARHSVALGGSHSSLLRCEPEVQPSCEVLALLAKALGFGSAFFRFPACRFHLSDGHPHRTTPQQEGSGGKGTRFLRRETKSGQDNKSGLTGMGPASHCFFTASPCVSAPSEACPPPGRTEEDSDGFRLGLIFFLPPYFPSRRMTSENACDPKKLSPFSFAASFSALASGQAWVIFSYKKKKEGEIIIQGKKK